MLGLGDCLSPLENEQNRGRSLSLSCLGSQSSPSCLARPSLLCLPASPSRLPQLVETSFASCAVACLSMSARLPDQASWLGGGGRQRPCEYSMDPESAQCAVPVGIFAFDQSSGAVHRCCVPSPICLGGVPKGKRHRRCGNGERWQSKVQLASTHRTGGRESASSQCCFQNGRV